MPAAPAFIEPMLATAGAPPRLEGWVAEPKLDGWRVQLAVIDGRLSVRSRRGRHLRTVGFESFLDLGLDLVVDGELVAGAGRSQDFYMVTGALGRLAPPGTARLALFDLLWLGGTSLLERPLSDRRRLLETLIPTGVAAVVPQFEGADIADLLAACEDLGVEGVVLKRTSAAYEPGRRSDSWRKLKSPHWRAVHGPKRRNF